ncbi:hypothetical protein B0A78_01585 [Flavobacterium columnare NBRC 100251 = ATCC 23463]|uniref:DUF6089 domain-containing protein n=2 Tax=Flavobacterium columnare TaxID=996 RepID=G8X7L8_FLACA|nr:DUF6089 family protein [Flavobacterium columnare]AEW85731.1 hypothetical protein FCOL_04500 [Flavobacterium columnare ATCC 49512]AMO20809.1 hypothetical protein UN65_11130 [Flavobacterium columnare]APT22010.1 hypothetical protein BU993_04790 [Flavobacterium columnare]AUX18803.1 hypothetical protein AQ623_11340 [Flavobacterium columnare]MBF6653265.1 hypothetical protein [Flavobacterium columnare]
MKKLAHILLFILAISQNYAQLHEIGVFGGGSNYMGDIGSTQFVSPKEAAFGFIYRWNKSKRHAWRFSAMTSTISGNDTHSNNIARNERGYSFQNKLSELSAGLEFNFFDFNLHENNFIITPYIHSGLTYFNYRNLYFKNSNSTSKQSSWAFAIPMTAGIKMKLTDKVILGLETSFHYTFIDDLDGSSPKDSALKNLSFGNTNSNDWYTFTGITLTYTFGQNPCYCKN